SEAFQYVCNALGMPWLLKPLCLMLALGAITTIFTWLLGPSKGLLQVAEDGYLPVFMGRKNSHNVPVNILLIQATIISLISLVVFFTPTISNAFWVFMALSAQIYMIMYILMFSAAFALLKKQPDLPRPYKIPGGIWGIGVVCGLGILASGSAFLAGFIPPDNIRKLGVGHSILYAGLLGVGTVFFFSLPLLLLRHEKKIRQSASK
ncbi:MAG: amino acid permease, partial [Victivallaceae bacterium]